MKSPYLLGLLVLGFMAAGCTSNDTPATPSATATSTLTATLLSSNEVPPIGGAETGAAGTATLRLTATKDSSGNVTAASLDVTVSATGFPGGTVLTASHIHGGPAGTNGGILLSFGLAAGEVVFPNGTGSFTKQSVAVTADLANSILANPAGFYVNIHTAANPGGVARGQLVLAQ
jgi:CHRD domain